MEKYINNMRIVAFVLGIVFLVRGMVAIDFKAANGETSIAFIVAKGIVLVMIGIAGDYKKITLAHANKSNGSAEQEGNASVNFSENGSKKDEN